MQTSIIIGATAATLVAASIALSSSADARVRHRTYGDYGAYGPYVFAPPYAPRYGYGAGYRYYDRIGSNSNPDRQMVGIGE